MSLTYPVWCNQALRGAMKNPSLAVDPTLTIEYQKLFTAASRYREVRSPSVPTGPTMLPCSCALPARSNTLAYSGLNPDLIILLTSCSLETLDVDPLKVFLT